jgi:predicted Fe-Mo cluster-binding NifX family protein
VGNRKIALATTDRLTVYQHFGHASEFHIAELQGDSYAFTEVRRIDPVCDGGEHSAAKFDAVIEALADVDALIVGKIGPGAAEYVAARGLKVFEVSGTVEKILTALTERKAPDGGFRAALRKT